MRFQGVLHPHAPRRFRLRFPAPRGRVRKCRRGSCSGIRRSEKTPSSSVRHAGQIESGRSFKSVSYRRTWSLQSQELHEMDDALPLASHIVERGRTYQYVRRVPWRAPCPSPGCRDLCKHRIGPRPRKPPAHVHSEAETQFAAARREKGTTVRRIARNSPMGSASSCSKMIGERARETEKMASTGNFESSLALSFAH